MNKKTEKNIGTSYIREKLPLLLIFSGVLLVFLLVAGLYGYGDSIENMSYAAVIILFVGVCGCGLDFLRYRSKCRKLQDALTKEGESDYCLPEPEGLAERLYYEIVCNAEGEKRKLLSELDEKKRDMEDYYTMWIHQIKTPIAALRLLQQRDGEELCGREKDGSGEELFKIEQYAEMALHYARLDSMSGDMLFEKCDISVIIKQAVKKYSVLFIGSGLSFSLEEFRCEAVTDSKWLTFVVEQILSNALKYTTSGGIRIYGAEGADGNKRDRGNGQDGGTEYGGTEYVVVEDSGIGISESDLPRIFERGFTGYNGRMEKKSTGIGLYLCKTIMDKLGHTITAKSKVGEGTRIILGFGQRNE